MSWSALAGLTTSALLHGALVTALLMSAPGAERLTPLFVDLTQEERPPGHEGGRTGSGRPARAAVPGRAGGDRAIPRAAPAPPAPVLDRTASQPEPPPVPGPTAPPVAAAPAPIPVAPLVAAPAPMPAPPMVAAPEVTAGPAVPDVPSVPSASSVANGTGSLSDVAPVTAHGGGDAPAGPSAPTARAGSGSGGERASHARGGSGAGPAGSGSGLAVVGPGEGTGDPGAAYAAYLGRLRQRVHQALRYPASARRRGVTGTVVLELTVKPDGAIGRVVVVDSSSDATLDAAAVDTVRSLQPQPFPADLPSRTLHVRLPVVFALQ